MHDRTNLPVPKQADIRADCATLFVSLELSRSTWVATSLAPGSKKMSKHALVGGNGRELLDLLARLKARAEQRSTRWKSAAFSRRTWIADIPARFLRS